MLRPQFDRSDRKNALLRTIALIVTAVMVIGIVPVASADDGDLGQVPLPEVEVEHLTNVTIDDHTIGNEVWALNVGVGDVTLLFMARNMTSTGNDTTDIDYQFNINYHTGGNLYIAQTTIMGLRFSMGDQGIPAALRSCESFTMNCTPVSYIGDEPTMYCNITFYGMHLHTDDSASSTFDLTLSHFITIGWNQTDVKVSAIIDLSRLRIVDNTGVEYADGTEFAIEIPYFLSLRLPDGGRTIHPTSGNGTGMVYDVEFKGKTLTVSKLTMNNTFTVINRTGSHLSKGYSDTTYSSQAEADHWFLGLVYNDTVGVVSDPELSVYYDQIETGGSGNFENNDVYLIVAIVAVAAVIAAFFVIRREKGRK